MLVALAEARQGLGRTAPNPPVGAVITNQNREIGRGWHRGAGRPHAEREAITHAITQHGKAALKGATIYVTLEPCSTHGRTPPCTDAIIDSGISRVVYACTDLNPLHAGKADEVFAQRQIQVTKGVLEHEALILLRPFFKVRTTGLPWVIWKTAMSLDGKISRPPGESRWLTSAEALADVQKLRAECDAILTSGETVRRDYPALTLRDPGLLEGRSQPWRVIFSNRPETLPDDAPLFTDTWKERTLIRSRQNLRQTLNELARARGTLCTMVEAGGVFSAALLEADLIDEVVVYMAPMLCGGHNLAMGGLGLPQALQLKDAKFTQLGSDVRLRALVCRQASRSRSFW